MQPITEQTEIAVALPIAAWRFLLSATEAASLPHQPRAAILAEATRRLDAALAEVAPPSPEFSPGVPQVNLPES